MSEFREPWKKCDRGYVRDAGEQVMIPPTNAILHYPYHPGMQERVVAAVNFCRNLPTEYLQRHVAVDGCADLPDNWEDFCPSLWIKLNMDGCEETSE